MRDTTARTVIDVLRQVVAIRKRWERTEKEEVDLWFRGVGSTKHTLTPGAYRKPGLDEEGMVNEFEQLSSSYFQREPTGPWDWYFHMQHYRLPTRLLDWTESPLVALYFALDSWEHDRGRKRRGRPAGPCLWILEPGTVNLICTDGVDNAPIIPGEEFSAYWLPRRCGVDKPMATFNYEGKNYTNARPLAIMPKRREPRILAQQGMFTVHGTQVEPLEKVLERDKRGRIARIKLANPSAVSWQEDLRTLGVFHAALFPEPDSIAKDLRKRYKA